MMEITCPFILSTLGSDDGNLPVFLSTLGCDDGNHLPVCHVYTRL